MTQAKFISRPCPHCGQPYRTINGLWLRDKREKAGLDQRGFGKILGLSSPYISDIERNRRDCPEEVLKAYMELGS